MRLPAVGDIFDGCYAVDEAIGEGGFAAVFRARELANERTVALKIVKPGPRGYDAQIRARHDREVRMISGLRDPHTVALLGCGESASGLLYMVFEHLPGEDLRDLIARRGRLQPDEVAHFMRQLMLSLREAHASGLLHRDIKPDNLRLFQSVADPLAVKLIDFGIARATDDGHPSITKTGELIGTPRYMSPEQLRGQPLTPASDIYSAGMVGIEMLLGSHVLPGNRWTDQLDRLTTDQIFDVARAAPANRPMLAVLQRMTAQSPERRYPSAAAVLADLDRLDEPGAFAPMPMQTMHAPPPTHSRTLFVLAGAASAAIVAVAVAVLTQEDAPPPLPSPRAPMSADALLRSTAPEPEPPSPVVDTDTTCSPFVGTGTLRAAGERTLAHIPDGIEPDTRVALVVLLHQPDQTPADFLSRFVDVADEQRFVVLSPDAGTVGWQELDPDIIRITEIIESTVEQLCMVDPTKIFLVGQGHSSLAVSLMCAPWVAGVATHGFPTHVNARNTCTEARKPYMLLAPKKSRFEPFDGKDACMGRPQVSVPDTEKIWRKRLGCGEKRETTFSHDDGKCFSWSCDVPFASCHIDGGHNWPGSSPRGIADMLLRCDGPDSNFPLAEQVWQFFANVPTSP